MKRCVNDETIAFMEEQFAECMDFGQLSDLYADFQWVLKELLLSSIVSLNRLGECMKNEENLGLNQKGNI